MSENMNRLGNINNKYQTETKRVLCLCSAGLLRSPTMANVLHKEFGFNTRAAGVAKDFALVVVDEVLLEWADEVVCVNAEVRDDLAYFMEARHMLREDYNIVMLDLPDRFEWNAPELRKLIKEQYKNYLEKTIPLRDSVWLTRVELGQQEKTKP